MLIANLGLDGGVWKLAPDGELTPFLLEVDGMRLHPTNFVGLDPAGRIWVTVSTRLIPREQAMYKGYGDGYIVLVDDRGARIVADGIGFTNEAIPDPAGRFLYVNETQGRRISRLPILGDRLGERETVCEFPDGIWPDGMAHDAQGGVWVVSVVSNRILRIDTATGQPELFLEDADLADVAEAEAAWQSGAPMPRHLLDIGGKQTLGNASSLAFGGPDLRTLYIGTLAGSRIGVVDVPGRTRHAGEHGQHHASGRRGRVGSGLTQRAQPGVGLAQLLGDIQEVARQAGEVIEPCDDDERHPNYGV